MLTFGSLFTGVGGFDLGFERAGMRCLWQAEIDKYCREVLNRHFEVPIVEDVRNVTRKTVSAVDVVCGGSPCQDVSIAGRRTGIHGERSGLFFEFIRVLEELKPGWFVFENVPGLLSSNGGRDFRTVLLSLAECGYGVCYRVLDSQYFGVPQRRRRVYVVGHRGDGRAAHVLFERDGGGGDIAAGTQSSEGDTGRFAPCVGERRTTGTLAASGAGTSRPAGQGNELDMLVHTEVFAPVSRTITSEYGRIVNNGQTVDSHYVVSKTLTTGEGKRNDFETQTLLSASQGVRRLTPTECARLQGFPDDWNVGLSDAQRYKQFGNAVTVNVAEWIARRIIAVEQEAR